MVVLRSRLLHFGVALKNNAGIVREAARLLATRLTRPPVQLLSLLGLLLRLVKIRYLARLVTPRVREFASTRRHTLAGVWILAEALRHILTRDWSNPN